MGLSSAYCLLTYTFEFGHCFLYCGPKAGVFTIHTRTEPRNNLMQGCEWQA